MPSTTITHSVTVAHAAVRQALDSSLAWSIVSGVGILILAATQAWIAYRKLNLDLFALRFACYQALITALNERLTEISRSRTAIADSADEAAGVHALWTAKQRMRLLFSQRVSRQLEVVENDVKKLADSKALIISGPRYTEEDRQASIAATKAYQDREATLYASRERLDCLVRPLMVQYGLGPIFFTGLLKRK